MRVLQISHTYPREPADRYGITMWDQVRALRSEEDVLSDVIAPVPWVPWVGQALSARWRRLAAIAEHACDEGIEVVFPRYGVLPRGLLSQRARRSFASSVMRARHEFYTTRTYDLVHAHMALPDGLAALHISAKMQCPFVVTMQCTDIDCTASKSTRARRQLATVFEAAAQVIAPSPRLAREYHSLFGGAALTVPYGIHARDLHGDPGDVRRDASSAAAILCVARLIPTKGIDILLHSARQLLREGVRLHLVIIGDGPSRESLRSLAKDLGVDGDVSFLGYLPHREVLKHMAVCDAFVLPSWRETFGLVYLEAMAAGRPVIAVRGQGVDGIVEEQKTGYLVSPHSVPEVTYAIRRILSRPDEARCIGMQARELVLSRYTWEKCAQATAGIYEEVLRES